MPIGQRQRDEGVEVIEATTNPEAQSQEVEIAAEEGDLLLLAVDFFEKAEADLVDQWGEIVRPEREVETRSEGRGFLCRTYRIARTGVYRARIFSRRATATIVRFGRDTGLALIGRGEPNRTTCFVCSKIVSVAVRSVLAAHGIHIPSIEVHIPWEHIGALVQNLPDVRDCLHEVSDWIPSAIKERLATPLYSLFHVLRSRVDDFLGEPIPKILTDPIGQLAGLCCKFINLCPAAGDS